MKYIMADDLIIIRQISIPCLGYVKVRCVDDPTTFAKVEKRPSQVASHNQYLVKLRNEKRHTNTLEINIKIFLGNKIQSSVCLFFGATYHMVLDS